MRHFNWQLSKSVLFEKSYLERGMKNMAETEIKQRYKYRKANSILQGRNEYELEQEEFYVLYNFFVTYSVCENQSFQKRSFVDYGWSTNNIINQDKTDTDLGKTLKNHLNLYRKEFIFSEQDNLKILFPQNALPDKVLPNYDIERFVIGITNENNQYIKLFHHVRNCLAHGKFVLKYSSSKEKMIVFQDNDKYNVTARMILKLQTLIDLVKTTDKNGLIIEKENNRNKNVA